MKSPRILTTTVAALAVFTIAAATTHAAVFVVSEAALSVPALTAADVVDFSEVANGTPVNGLSIDGYTFSENTPEAFTNIGGGPGNTNHIDGSMALQLSGPFDASTYKLTIQLPGASTAFGFGYAVLASAPLLSAVTITLFDGAVNVGSMSFDGVADPGFPGGFAGIGSTIAFNSAEITFNTAAASYAIDNVASFNNQAPGVAVPEPGSALVGMLVLGVCGMGATRRRRTAAVAND